MMAGVARRQQQIPAGRHSVSRRAERSATAIEVWHSLRDYRASELGYMRYLFVSQRFDDIDFPRTSPAGQRLL